VTKITDYVLSLAAMSTNGHFVAQAERPMSESDPAKQ
jgi:hypothetical protein